MGTSDLGCGEVGHQGVDSRSGRPITPSNGPNHCIATPARWSRYARVTTALRVAEPGVKFCSRWPARRAESRDGHRGRGVGASRGVFGILTSRELG